LTRLKNMLLNEENIRTLTELTQDYWWALVLGLLGLMGFMSIFVKICSVHTPSSNPRLKPARSFSFKHRSHAPQTSTEIELSSSQQQQQQQPKIYVRGLSSSDNKTNMPHL